MKNFFVPLLLTVLISGCCFDSGKSQVEYFDIGMPPAHAAFNYSLGIVVKANDIYDNKMVFTKDPHTVYFDSFNLWAQAPHRMLTSYFKLYFNNLSAPPVKNQIPIALNINIIKFECNLSKKECLFYAEASCINTKTGKLLYKKFYTEHLPMKKLTASSFASSMANTVRNVAQKIEHELKRFVLIRVTSKG